MQRSNRFSNLGSSVILLFLRPNDQGEILASRNMRVTAPSVSPRRPNQVEALGGVSLSASNLKLNDEGLQSATGWLSRNLIQRLNFGFAIAFVVRVVINIDIYVGIVR